MNILFLSELFYPHGGGAELATHLYANLLSKEDLDVVVVTNRFPGETEVSKEGNLTVYRLPLLENESIKYSMLKRLDVTLSGFIKKLVKSADVVYIPRFWYPAALLAKAYGKPVITHLHDYIPICPLATFYDVSKQAVCKHAKHTCSPRCIYAFEKTRHRGLAEALASVALNSTLGFCFGNFVRLSDAIICVSKMQRDLIVSKKPSLCDKACVVYNPLPEVSYARPEDDHFGYYGGLNYLKGFHILYQAMRRIRPTSRGVIQIHVTKFTNFPGQLAKSLGELGFLLHGTLNKDEYDRLHRQIRAVIVPSIWSEPWPYVVVEALVGGRFLIASSIGGIPEQVEGCKGALLFEAGNHKRLAEAIESVKNLERETVIELGFQNRETFLNRFDNGTTINKFINICENLT